MNDLEQWVNALYISSATVLALGVAAKALHVSASASSREAGVRFVRLDVRALARGGTIKRVK